jgi:hypothetical protein
MKLYYYKNTKLFHCYSGCDETFDIYELFEKRYSLLHKKYDFYKDVLLIINKDYRQSMLTDFADIPYERISDKYARKIQSIKLKHYNPNVLSVFNKYYPVEWLEDGISKDAMDKFNILYSISRNKIIIPHYDKDNNLIGIRARSLNEEDIVIGKYMPIKIEKTLYSHPLAYNLYGLNFNSKAIKDSGFAIVYESEKAVLMQEGIFNNNSVAVCGSNFNKYQIQLLMDAGAREIIIAFDKEFTNRQERDKYFQKLWDKCVRYKNYCQMSFILDDYGLLNHKDSPIDRGQEKLIQLIKNRIKVG